MHAKSKSTTNGDYKNIVKNAIINGSSALGERSDEKPQLKSSNKIFLARISGPQVTQAAQKKLGVYSTSVNVNNFLSQDNSQMQKRSSKQDIQQIEFKNGSVYQTNEQKNINSKPSLHNQKKMMKFNKSKQQTSLDMTSQFTMSQLNKSGGQLGQRKKVMSPKASLYSGAANIELIKSLYHQDMSTKQSNVQISMASDAINNIDLYRPGSHSKKQQRLLMNAKIKTNLTSQNDNPFDSYTSKTVGQSNIRQIKTQQQARSIHNTSSKIQNGNSLMDSSTLFDSTLTNRKSKLQKKANTRPLSSETKQHVKNQHCSLMSGQSTEDMAKVQAQNIVQKLNKRLEKNQNLQLSEDQILQNYSKYQNTCQINNLPRQSIEINNNGQELNQNGNIFKKLQNGIRKMDNPIKINQTIEIQQSEFRSTQPVNSTKWNNKKAKQLETLKSKINQGLMQNINFQKGNIISQDHMRQLLGTSNQNSKQSHFNVEVPSAMRASYDAPKDTIQTLGLSSQPTYRQNQDQGTIVSEFESLYQDFKPDIRKGSQVMNNSQSRHMKRHSVNNISLTTGRASQKAAYYLSPQKNILEDYQAQKEKSFVKINDVIHKMFDNVSGTPIRNSLQVFVNQNKLQSYNSSPKRLSPIKEAQPITLTKIKEENQQEFMLNSQSHSQPKNIETIEESYEPSQAQIFENAEADQMESYLKNMKEVKIIQQRLNDNPNVYNIVNNKVIQGTTFLSPFTILENSFVGLTSDHLHKQATEKLIGRTSQKPLSKPMHEVLKQSKLRIMSVQNDLKRIVDTGEMHTQLNPNHILDLELFPKITKCFILDLKEYENPLIIRFKYHSKTEQQAVAVLPLVATAKGTDGKSPTPDPAAEKKEQEKKDKQKKSVSRALSPKGTILGDLYAYGSFYNKEPNESNTWQQIKNQPRKIIIKEPSEEPYFSNKFFYLTLESTTGIKISIMAQTKPDQDNANKKKAAQKKKEQKQQQAAESKSGVVPTQQKSGSHLCSQQRQDIQKAFNDKNVELQLIHKMEDALDRQKMEKKLKRSGMNENSIVDSTLIIDKDILKINKEQQASYHETKRARIIYGSVQRENNIEYARQKMLKDQAEQRADQLQKNNKWQDFKLRRKVVIEKYIAAKAIQRKSEQLLVLIKRGLWISIFAKFFKQYIVKRVKEENTLFCLFRAKFWWKQRMKKLQASKEVGLTNVHTNYIRYAITVAGNASYMGQYSSSQKIFCTVIKDLCYTISMKNKFRLAYSQLSRIQKGFRRALGVKNYTYTKLKKAWDIKVSEMHHKAMGKKTKVNAETLKQCHRLLASDKDPTSPVAILIKTFLQKWLYWCQLRYSIAFFQWRRKFKMYVKEEMFPLRCASQDEELDEVFDSKIGYIRRYSHRLYDKSEQIRVAALNQQKSTIKKNESTENLKAVKDDKKNPRRSAKKLGGAEAAKKETNIFEINHFHEIGWMHPDKKVQDTSFAGEGDCNNIVRKEFDDLVYDPELYVSGDFVPSVIWMPCDEIMQVMIKAASVSPDIDTLLYSFGIPSLCFKCQQDLQPKNRDRFMWSENEFTCVHTDYHIKCMIEVAKEQDVPIEKVKCPVCLSFQNEHEQGDGHEHHHHE